VSIEPSDFLEYGPTTGEKRAGNRTYFMDQQCASR
jgi:hypothetical protein